MRYLHLAFAALCCSCLLAGPAFAQGTSVTGTLKNGLSGDPVAGATVIIEELGREVRTDSAGRFTLSNIAPGPYHVLVRANGFMPRRSEVTVAASELTLDLSVDPEQHYSEVVSVSPSTRNQFESYQPTTVLAGQELEKERLGTLGETLQYQPGIASRSLGPGPSRPVIRGLDGDRVLILQNGQRMGDLSSQSGDHGVTTNPAAATRIEVVRGPATLLYGANAIGGLVNVISDDIPREAVSGVHGSMSLDAGSAASEGAGAGNITIGNGELALNLNGSGRRAGSYGTPDGEIPNSFARSGFGGAGLSWTGQNGFFGGSFSVDRTVYGVPLIEDGTTSLDPRRTNVNLRGERRNLNGFFTSVRGSFGVRRYRHDEREGEDEIASQFTNNQLEFDILGNHRPVGKLKGSVGAWALGRSFKVEGEEALSPPVDQRTFAGFFYEEYTVDPHVSLQFGGRVERSSFTPDSDDPARDFTNFSGSVGLLVHPSESTTVAVNLARAVRNPALEELYFRGPHAGTFAYETGNPDLQSERAFGVDLSLRWRGSRASGEVTYFLNNIDNFIFREYTGAIEEELPETFFTAGDARLQGIESHVDVSLTKTLSVEGGLDYVHGELLAVDRPMPRVPPLRGRLGARYQKNAFTGGADLVINARQSRTFAFDTPGGVIGELPTPGSELLRLFASYSFQTPTTVSTLTLRVDNLTNQLYRAHLNYLKDLIPEMGRNVKLLYTVRF